MRALAMILNAKNIPFTLYQYDEVIISVPPPYESKETDPFEPFDVDIVRNPKGDGYLLYSPSNKPNVPCEMNELETIDEIIRFLKYE
ncbi:hypothetical protein CW747_02430 [Staphylococcus shinii]|uniref:hypothetical protein n=1 Tax=Staphylococcus shinii TaxID=2912228 RepID=UPI000C32CD1E|nr:hypothetical protein [Staphylococcus shinii]PKI11015.1 hypothetical protein CW747_02430 [Staphylococcus shinii]